MNTAADELAKLQGGIESFEQQAQKQAQVASERGTQGAAVRSSGKKEEAKFAAPEALATTVVGSFLFGPAGGLLLGAAQGFLGKKERQNILDQQAKRNEAISGAEDVLRGRFDTLRMGRGVSEEDIDLLDTLKTNQEMGFRMMRSGDPQIMQNGMAILQSVNGSIEQFSRDQETQRIDAQVREEALAERMGQEGYNRYKDIQKDFDSQSANYIASIEKGNEILNLLESGNPFDLNAALIGMAKLNDPTSAAMEGEVNAWRNIGTLLDKSQKIASNLDGKALNAKQARELQQTVLSIIDAREQIQLRREAMFQSRLDAAEVPQQYWGEFKLTESMPAVNPRSIEWETLTGDVRKAGKALYEAAELGIDAAEDVFDSTYEAGARALDFLATMRVDPNLPIQQQLEQAQRIQDERERRNAENADQ